MNLQPQILKPNDKVAVIAPSGRVFKEELEAGFKLIEAWQLKACSGKHLYKDYYFGYHYAGTIEERAEDLQSAIDNEEIKAIWMARGGYGAAQLLDRIDWSNFINHPKWLIGYSDITAIHNHLNKSGVQTIHGITVKRLDVPYTDETFESLRRVLFGEKLNYEIQTHPFNQNGTAEGQLVGGNLSLIYSLTGSVSEINGDNLILFIEDWNENWYHLDRMLLNLERSGLLGRIKGLIVGSFTRMDTEEENQGFRNDFDNVSYEIIHNFMKKYKIPVCYGFPAGHTGDNRALIMGAPVRLEVNQSNVKLEF